MARVHDQSENPLSVAQHGSSVQEHVWVERNLGTIQKFQSALKFVDVLVRGLAVYLGSIKLGKGRLGFTFGQAENALIRLFVLQVRFTVQIFGLHIADSFRKRTSQQDQISWEKVVFFDLNNAAHLESITTNVLEGGLPPGTPLHNLSIFLFVTFFALSIFKGVFDHGDKHHKTEGHNCEDGI